jgi:hypothetical protein
MGRGKSGINYKSVALGTVCQECNVSGGWWLHLRRCAECGHIGCCDSSPNQHAKKHAAESGHNIIMSFEPLQSWFFDYTEQRVFRARKLLPPLSRPKEQAAPGPRERVPDGWEKFLNDC